MSVWSRFDGASDLRVRVLERCEIAALHGLDNFVDQPFLQAGCLFGDAISLGVGTSGHGRARLQERAGEFLFVTLVSDGNY